MCMDIFLNDLIFLVCFLLCFVLCSRFLVFFLASCSIFRDFLNLLIKIVMMEIF